MQVGRGEQFGTKVLPTNFVSSASDSDVLKPGNFHLLPKLQTMLIRFRS